MFSLSFIGLPPPHLSSILENFRLSLRKFHCLACQINWHVQLWLTINKILRFSEALTKHRYGKELG